MNFLKKFIVLIRLYLQKFWHKSRNNMNKGLKLKLKENSTIKMMMKTRLHRLLKLKQKLKQQVKRIRMLKAINKSQKRANPKNK